MTGWRIVLTLGSGDALGDWTGVAMNCPRQMEPGGPHDDVMGLVPDGFYEDCCPGVILECGDRYAAAEVLEVLNRNRVEPNPLPSPGQSTHNCAFDPDLDDTPSSP